MSPFVKKVNEDCSCALSETVAASKSLAYFLGSGISAGDYPNWPGLAERMETIYGENGWPWVDHQRWSNRPKNNAPESLQEIFQMILEHNPSHYFGCLQQIFDEEPLNHRPYLLNIAKSIPQLILTLNFDSMIERVYTNMGLADKLETRAYPRQLYTAPERSETTVLYHLHGTLYDGIHMNPDHLVLHRAGYAKAYTGDYCPLRNCLMQVFLQHDFIFIGTGLNEPELQEFFRTLTDRVKDAEIQRKRIALLATEVPLEVKPTEKKSQEELYIEEQKSDLDTFKEQGIQCIRYFKLNEQHKGLQQVLSRVLSTESERPKPAISW
ncbi:SIR2 family protein [Cerasicoccus maritimus]|uniref:SIR2 family protein n=1 Tax=Cerasicoccus maritimus TaxID=490089 RepID=UPI002852D9F9|nr:SIR2 family protein [Cerasicoccus maritimus]